LKEFHRLALGVVLGAVLAAPGGAQTFTAIMSGGAETPPGPPEGSGLAAVTLNGTTVEFALSVRGIGDPTAAHIHIATTGAVVVPLNPAFTNGVGSGSVTTTADIAAAIVANPSGYYVNVHTAAFPAGAIRGTLNGGPSSSVTYATTLTGAGEAPAAASTTGGGLAVVTISGSSVTFSLLVNGIAPPTAAHIHRGVAGTSGPILVGFNPVFAGGVASGTVTTTEALATEILAHPSNFYVNVHNADFPGGAIRGQLDSNLPIFVYLPTITKADGVNGTKFVSDLRILNATGIAANVTAYFYAANSAGLSAPTATTSFPVQPNSQAVIDDALSTLFSVSGSGALLLSSDRPVVVRSRVLNDLRSLGQGTTGVLVPGLTIKDSRTGATLPLLSNASASDIAAGRGFRTNLGFFNPEDTVARITFTAFRNDGTVMGTAVVNAPPLARVQQSVFTLIPVSDVDREQPDFYITFTSDVRVFVYAVTVDNETGDSIYLDAASAP
jgi:hypothetical protein